MVDRTPAIGRVVLGIPAFNEEQHLGAVLRDATSRPGDHCVIVVDDGSCDQTWDVASGWPGVCAIRHPENRGMAAAQLTLLREFLTRSESPDDILILIHADGAMDLSELDRFLERFRETDADVVLGSRLLWWWRNLKVRGLFRTFCDMAATLLENVAFRTWLTSYGSGFRAWKRRGVERLDLENMTSRGASFDVEIVAHALLAGLVIAEVPIRALPRLRSSSYLLTTYAGCVARVIARLGVLRWTTHGTQWPQPVGAGPGLMSSRHPRWRGAHRPAR
jgi:dolichol-phosphate mannosyltransferase